MRSLLFMIMVIKASLGMEACDFSAVNCKQWASFCTHIAFSLATARGHLVYHNLVPSGGGRNSLTEATVL